MILGVEAAPPLGPAFAGATVWRVPVCAEIPVGVGDDGCVGTQSLGCGFHRNDDERCALPHLGGSCHTSSQPGRKLR